MPHIEEKRRSLYSELLYVLSNTDIENKGDLEYIIYNVLKHYMSNKEERYSTLHETVYAGIHACEEFKRLRLDERENVAIQKNGEA